MIRRLTYLTALVSLLCAMIPSAAAQTSGQGERVTLAASDDLTLVGLYYAPPAGDTDPSGAPAVLLMHHSGSRKEAWIDLIPVLHDAGYAVLTIDLRGHGETRGKTDWVLAEDDTHRWLEWLRQQPGVDADRVSIVGASIGADVGLRVMADDDRLVTLIGLSVGLDVQGVETQPAVEAIGNRPLFLVAGQGAADEADAARTLLGVAQGDVQIRLYANPGCCTFLFMLEPDLAPAIVHWLDAHR